MPRGSTRSRGDRHLPTGARHGAAASSLSTRSRSSSARARSSGSSASRAAARRHSPAASRAPPRERGRIVLDGAELPRRRSDEQHRAVQIVFQDPYSSLNPRLTSVGAPRAPPRARTGTRSAIEVRCRELMALVGLPAAALDGYPSSFSGGQRQRLAIARALAVEPRILDRRRADRRSTSPSRRRSSSCSTRCGACIGVSILFVSHNLAAVRHLCDRVAVMYLGRIVEVGARAEVFRLRDIPTPERCSPRRPGSTAGGRPARGSRASRRARSTGRPAARSTLVALGPRRSVRRCRRRSSRSPGARSAGPLASFETRKSRRRPFVTGRRTIRPSERRSTPPRAAVGRAARHGARSRHRSGRGDPAARSRRPWHRSPRKPSAQSRHEPIRRVVRQLAQAMRSGGRRPRRRAGKLHRSTGSGPHWPATTTW